MKKNILIASGLLMAGFAAILFALTTTTQGAAAASQSALVSVASSEQMCPLSASQQEKAAAAFEKMMPTFQHPRCANCHGGVRPFEANTNHAGGKFDLMLSAEGDLQLETFDACQTCHGGLKNWEVPTQSDFFVGKSAEELCKQMKVLGNAETFMDHITRDRGKTPFIETAFAGMRGLSGEGIDFYESLNDKKPVPEPPSISHAALIDQAQGWVDAMGGEFQGDFDCGCAPTKYAIQVDEAYTADFQTDKARLQWNGSTTVQIPLTFKDDGTFTGEATSQRTMNVKLTSAISCDGTETSQVKWQVAGKLDYEGQVISFSIRFTPASGLMQCGILPAMPLPVDNSEDLNNPLKQVEMTPLIGETKTVELETSVAVTPSKDTFKITLIHFK